jgi:hypothetical protein
LAADIASLAQGAPAVMTRTHRLVHRMVWPALALVVAFAFVMALELRAPPPPEAPAQTQESTR